VGAGRIGSPGRHGGRRVAGAGLGHPRATWHRALRRVGRADETWAAPDDRTEGRRARRLTRVFVRGDDFDLARLEPVTGQRNPT